MDANAEMLARAQEQDLNRQRQIENQKQSLNRMLEREQAVRDIANAAVAEGNNSQYIDQILEVLNG